MGCGARRDRAEERLRERAKQRAIASSAKQHEAEQRRCGVADAILMEVTFVHEIGVLPQVLHMNPAHGPRRRAGHSREQQLTQLKSVHEGAVRQWEVDKERLGQLQRRAEGLLAQAERSAEKWAHTIAALEACIEAHPRGKRMLHEVAPAMIEEWSVTKRAPKHAAWLHEEIANAAD